MASVSLTGSGIDFSDYQTPAAGMASESLDHYEEGTFNPYLNGSSDFASGTNTGRYTRVGNLVNVAYTCQSTNLAGELGNAQVYIPTPFTVRAGDTNRMYNDWYFAANGTASYHTRAHANGGGSTAPLYHITATNTDGTGTGTPIIGNECGNSTCLMRGNIIFFV